MTQIFSPKASVVSGVTTAPIAVILPSIPIPDLSGNNPGRATHKGVDVAMVFATPGTLGPDDAVMITFGDANVIASLSNSILFRPGTVLYLQLQPTDTHFSVASTAATAGVFVTVGSMR